MRSLWRPYRRDVPCFSMLGSRTLQMAGMLGPIIVIRGNHGLSAREITALLHPEP